MTRLSDLSVGGAFNDTDLFYVVETQGVGGVSKTPLQMASFTHTMNNDDVLYLSGDETTNGSLRIIPDLADQTQFEFQLRSNDVWNDTGIVIAASTVYLGRELQISAGGEWVLTKDTDSDIESLLPHVRFDVVAGTDATVTLPQVSALVEDVIIQPDDTGEIAASVIQFVDAAAALVFANALRLRTGAAATGDVNISLYRNSFTSGLFYSRNYPAATFSADSDIVLTTDGLVELFEGEDFYVVLTCDGTLTLKADVTNTTPYWGGDFYFATEKTITPDDDGGALYLLLFDNEGNPMCDNTGQAILAEPNNVELPAPETTPAPAFISALDFSDDISTEDLSSVPTGLYRYLGTTGSTLTLSDVTKTYADDDTFWRFTVKDEGGNCTAQPLTITPESGLIDGAASIQLVVDFGSVFIYSDGTNYWSI